VKKGRDGGVGQVYLAYWFSSSPGGLGGDSRAGQCGGVLMGLNQYYNTKEPPAPLNT